MNMWSCGHVALINVLNLVWEWSDFPRDYSGVKSSKYKKEIKITSKKRRIFQCLRGKMTDFSYVPVQESHVGVRSKGR